ncbi:N-acetylglucosaminyldiphosphoundecaprenol N-acetyl-beta-D-mannosaminyltransferase [Bradyrhizobium lablabi]|uniref:N-acetylglucosaminyldiphosphoundecaprenol N-acetyl-beta-D-mannosaminyltransferase n=1 Tax=Bradyrhizobium lablabi TaxID=722472 RepID=A0A1M6MPQ6_9BRAD|nr:WecB/TagA/CpsF family glycosyltransferase [Bradyrhizobium lablabi]SHJ85414.1 N-acetylglucosaminyldiphosphoundecaprenol N-acetyl-beta-D-mannosaminyltransferase [Bradyrhizobium lablabi]
MRFTMQSATPTDVRLFNGSLDSLLKQTARPEGGPLLLVTPNLDHLRLLWRTPAFRRAYASADLIVNDSRFLDKYFLRGNALCAPGSDIVPTFLGQLNPSSRVCVVGFTENVKSEITKAFPGLAFSFVQPSMGYILRHQERLMLVKRVLEFNPDIVLVCTGAPQSEIFAAQLKRATEKNMSILCCGSALHFLTGEKKRSSETLRNLGMEWAFRFFHEAHTRKRYLYDSLFLFTKLSSFVTFRLNGSASFGRYRLNAHRAN